MDRKVKKIKEYHLEHINENSRNLSLLLILPLFFGGSVVTTVWNDPLWGKLSLILVLFLLLVIVYLYFNTRENFDIKIDANALLINNKFGGREKRINIEDIALIQYDKSANDFSTLTDKKSSKDTLMIVSKTGKTILYCDNNINPSEFDKFFKDIRKRINAKEKLVYTKKVRLTSLQRSLFINPKYEDSSLAKNRIKQSGFFYPLIIFLLIIITIMILGNLFFILYD